MPRLYEYPSDRIGTAHSTWELPGNISAGIALYLPQRPGAMRGGRNAYGGTVVLGVGLRTVPTQKHPPQIGRLAAQNRKQLWVRATGQQEGLRVMFSWNPTTYSQIAKVLPRNESFWGMLRYTFDFFLNCRSTPCSEF